MKIGYACLSVGVNELKSYRTCVVKNYNEDLIKEIIEHNLDVLLSMLKYNKSNNIKMFRISSDIIPLASHVVNDFDWENIFKDKLSKIGLFIKNNEMRVSMHPGQYTVLNSINSDVVSRAIIDLEYHCNFLDSLGLDSTHKVILHIGGIYNDKKSAIERFEVNYLKLDQKIKARLVIENDDKSYNIKDVLAISHNLSIPVVFDNLHHQINNSNEFTELEWISKCVLTWKSSDGKCKVHYSNQNPNKKEGAHSEFIYINQFMDFYNRVKHLNIDIMLEVKDKNLSAIKCINCVNEVSFNTFEKEWAKYKYVILEKNHNTYKALREYLKDEKSFSPVEFYLFIEQALLSDNSAGGYRNSFDHVWGYFKKVCSDKEKELYIDKLSAFNKGYISAKAMKNFLLKMTIKYNSSYLLKSYYFSF